MKQYLSFLVCLVLVQASFAQNFQGKAIYQSKTSVSGDFGPRDMPEEQRQRMLERMKKAFEKTYVLSFDKSTSIYKEEEKLEQPGANSGGPRFGMFGDEGTYYKDVSAGTYANQKEFFGKIFLIKDTVPKLQWQMGSETKKIGNYTCYKATAVKKVDQDLINSFRGPRRDEKAEGDEAKDVEEIKIPNEITITAWYAPEISVSNGPGEYGGLPGLILELSTDRTTILCSKIVLNPEDKVKIEEPKKGKEVTQAEYMEIVAEKTKEMRERFRGGNRGGRRFGGQ